MRDDLQAFVLEHLMLGRVLDFVSEYIRDLADLPNILAGVSDLESLGDRVLASGMAVHAHAPDAFAAALRSAGFDVVSRRGHNFTIFPFGTLLEVPAVALSRAAEAAGLPAGLASDTVFVARKPGPAASPPPRPPPRPSSASESSAAA